jgi:replicative superfamily II helicase
MSEENKHEHGNLRDEFRSLGQNLKEMINSAWESEERKDLQGELEEGMRELGNVLNDFASNLKSGEIGQSIRREVGDVRDRVHSGEMEDKARQEILKALKVLNDELEKASQKFSASDPEQESKSE